MPYLPNGNRVTSFAYNNDQQPTDVTYADGRVDRMRYNASGRMTHVGNTQSQFVELGLNVAANTTWTSSARHLHVFNGPNLNPTAAGSFLSTAEYDSLGRPYTDIGNAGQRVSYRYDRNGNLLTRADAGGRSTTYEYDELNRPKWMRAADQGETILDYDAEGNLASVRDPRGITTSYTYNGFGQRLTDNSPNTGHTVFTCDAAGRFATDGWRAGRADEAVARWNEIAALQTARADEVAARCTRLRLAEARAASGRAGDLDAALQAVLIELPAMTQAGALSVAPYPMAARVAAWRVLHQARDPQAPAQLALAEAELQQLLDGFDDPAVRQRVTSGVPWHRDVLEARAQADAAGAKS